MFNRIQKHMTTTEQEYTKAVQERDDSEAEVAKWNKLANRETGWKYSPFKSDDDGARRRFR